MQKLLKFLLFLTVPAMVLGQIVNIEIQNFRYEVSASEFLIILTASLFIVYKIVKKDLNFYLPAIVAFFALYISISAFSILWAFDTSRVIIALRVGLYHVLVLILASNLIKNRQDLKYLFYSLAAAAVLISGQLVYQVYRLGGFFTQFIPERTSIITPVGPWVTVSAIIVFMVPIMYGLGLLNFKTNRALSILFFTGAIFSALSSMVTLGKSELIALIAGVIFFSYKYFNDFDARYFSRDRLVKIIIGAIILFIGVGFVLSPFIQGFTDRFQQTLRDENTKFRVREIQLTFSAIRDNFFIGAGAGNLKVYFRNNGLCQCYTEASNYFAHFFGELGIMGLLLFTAGGYSIAKALRSFKNLNLSKSDGIILLIFKSSLIIFLVNGFFEVTIAGLNYGIVFWMMIGALLAFKRITLTPTLQKI